MVGQAPWKGNNAPSTQIGRDLYFFMADTSKFNANPKNPAESIPKNVNIDNNLLQALQGSASAKELKDFYLVGLWSYCEGNKDAKTGDLMVTYCSERKLNFVFDPFNVWQLKNTSAQKVFGDKFTNGINTYHKVSGWMTWSFIIAMILTVVEFFIGFFALLSRWGSFVTTIISTAQTVFVIAAAGTATAMFATLTGVFNGLLKPYNIQASIGKKMFSVIWLCVAFSLASGFFWLISICCCSGKSPHKKVTAEKTPYTYERVASPAFAGGKPETHTGYAGASGHGTSGTAYEPFRQQHV